MRLLSASYHCRRGGLRLLVIAGLTAASALALSVAAVAETTHVVALPAPSTMSSTTFVTG